MFQYFKIAWRNLWRNLRRTIITSSSVFFGVFFVCFMTSMQRGSFENMIGNMARFYSGYIQIQNPGYKETPSLNKSLFYMNLKNCQEFNSVNNLVTSCRNNRKKYQSNKQELIFNINKI